MFKSLVFALILVLTGCSLQQQTKTLSVVASAVSIKYYYDNYELVEFVDNASLSEEEVNVVIETLNQIDRTRNKLKILENNPEVVLTNFKQVEYEYLLAYNSYAKLRLIVIKHWDEYSKQEQDIFKEFDDSLNTLDTEYKELVMLSNKNEVIKSALALSELVFRLSSLI